MDPRTQMLVNAICGGLLGWALGGVVDMYFPHMNLRKSRGFLLSVVLTMLAVMFGMRFGID